MLINIKTYENICSIVYEILDKLNKDADLITSCAIIHLLAKEVIEKNFSDIKVNFYCGTVVYNLDGLRCSYDYKEQISFNDPHLGSWHAFLILETNHEKFFIDFMAPLFDDVFYIEDFFIERKMFQKNINQSLTREDFFQDNFLNTKSGAFYFEIEHNLTQQIIANCDLNLVKNYGLC